MKNKKYRQIINLSKTPYPCEIIALLYNTIDQKQVIIKKGASIGITSGIIEGINYIL